jgi:hypothetical protein
MNFANCLARLMVRRRSNGASVYNNHLGLGPCWRKRVAPALKLALYGGGIGLRGPAPKLFDVERGHGVERILE